MRSIKEFIQHLFGLDEASLDLDKFSSTSDKYIPSDSEKAKMKNKGSVSANPNVTVRDEPDITPASSSPGKATDDWDHLVPKKLSNIDGALLSKLKAEGSWKKFGDGWLVDSRHWKKESGPNGMDWGSGELFAVSPAAKDIARTVLMVGLKPADLLDKKKWFTYFAKKYGEME